MARRRSGASVHRDAFRRSRETFSRAEVFDFLAELPRDRYAYREEPGDDLDFDGFTRGGAAYLQRPGAAPRRYGRSVSPSWRQQLNLAGHLVMRPDEAVSFCVRRKARREVLFALRRAGWSGSAQKRFWRRTEESNYSC